MAAWAVGRTAPLARWPEKLRRILGLSLAAFVLGVAFLGLMVAAAWRALQIG